MIYIKTYLQVIILLPPRVEVFLGICVHCTIVEVNFPDVNNFPDIEMSYSNFENLNKYLRNEKLYDVVHELFAHHHHHQLDRKFKEAARSITIVCTNSIKVTLPSFCPLSKLSRMLKKTSLNVKENKTWFLFLFLSLWSMQCKGAENKSLWTGKRTSWRWSCAQSQTVFSAAPSWLARWQWTRTAASNVLVSVM